MVSRFIIGKKKAACGRKCASRKGESGSSAQNYVVATALCAVAVVRATGAWLQLRLRAASCARNISEPMAKTFFITTAIDYTNSAPHIGHAYEKILADVIARYRRLKGDDVFFLTGVDQHGQKVQQSAEKEGVPPEQFVAGITEQFIALWDKLDVRYDAWAATTDPLHKKCVQGMLQRLFDEGKIYKDKQVGFYSVRQEQFLTDKDRNEAGEFGPEWGQVEEREEENYYFKLAEHKQWLLDFIDARSKAGNPFVVPDFRVAELRNAVEKIGDDRQAGSDLCISRPKSRLSWGIELPF